jgi:hypothetical protein
LNINDSFKLLLSSIEPTQGQINAAEQHLAAIKARLKAAFTLKDFLKTGSYSRGTYNKGSSDVDVFALVTRDDMRCGNNYVTSGTALERVKEELEDRFWNTRVYRDVHAIVVQFTDCRVDVVPAFFAGVTEQNWPLYSIPDGAGDWMRASPGLHNAWINQEDKAAGGKIRGTARLLKFWRECRSPRVPVSSFHIELGLASTGLCKGVKSYADCVTEMFQLLAQRECRAVKDPVNVSGYVPAVKSESQRESALASVRYSRDKAKAALSADAQGDLNEARRLWDIAFNGRFPW